MRVRSMLLATTFAALPLVAQAQPVNGLYVAGGAGLNIMQDETDASQNGISTPGKSLQFDAGATGVASVGWGFGNGLRTELELDYLYNSLKSSTTPAKGTNAASGSEQKFGPMVNVLYDFNGLSPRVVPYIGAGIGYQWADVNNGGEDLATGTAGAFAYQAIIGAAVPIAAVPGLAVTAEYRFMGLAGNRDYNGGPLHNTITRTDDYNHSVLIGVRYNFGAAPPPPPAPMMAPAPAPARSYLVFFDWDKATLSDRARSIIHEAAENSMKVKYTAIEVNGYTDTSGTAKYNQGLSVRRAQAVAAELVRDGVPKSAIAIQGFGETHLLVPTGPGMREPQNRRVEIIIK